MTRPRGRVLSELACWWARELWATAAECARTLRELFRGAGYLLARPPGEKRPPRPRG
jgi:hypothetical protein